MHQGSSIRLLGGVADWCRKSVPVLAFSGHSALAKDADAVHVTCMLLARADLSVSL